MTDLPSREWSSHYAVYRADGKGQLPSHELPLARAARGESCDAELMIRVPESKTDVWIEASGRPLKDETGAVRGGVVAFRDVTQAKAAEREIRKLNEELERRVVERTAALEASNRELEAFTYSVSHDLRAPLRHIAGFSGILLEDFKQKLEPEAQHHLQRIHQGTEKMGRLVDELLNLARVGRQALKLQNTELSDITQEAIRELAPETQGREIEWRVAALPSTACDPTLVKQIFQNLIANALKYSRPRQHAVIEIGQQENALFVRDNGVGFNMKYADKLFGVFQRLHRAEEFEGTGVGLATVKRIVEKHGGRVWAESKPDAGATFYFTLNGEPQAEFAREALSIGA
jgi:light-regulated signal transduction histidine kinase (bacteriophytochrome)